jgi:DNA-binding XRE family transcriptional regulator
MASVAPVLRQAPQTSEGTMPRSLFGRPSNRTYKAAVAQIIRDVKSRHKLSNERLAEIIGCSETTVFNAENEASDLAAVTLLSIAYAFGEEAIDPVRQLYLCAPIDPPTKDSLIKRAIGLLNKAEGME